MKDIKTILKKVVGYDGNDIQLLSEIINSIRPSKRELKKGELSRIDDLIKYLTEDREVSTSLRQYIDRVIENRKISNILTDTDVILGIDFWKELKDRITYKILPNLPDKNSLEYVLVNIFYREIDGKWVSLIDEKKCKDIFEILGYSGIYEREIDSFFIKELLFAVRILSHRITGNAFDIDILRMVPKYANLESPFAALQDEVDHFINNITEEKISRDKEEIHLKHLHVIIDQCKEFIDTAYRNKEKFGISFKVHQQLLLMDRLLDRLSIILNFLTIDKEFDSRIKFVNFVKMIISFHSGQYKISDYINKSIRIMAKVISQNIGQNGEKYITNNAAEYWAMFRTAIGGGAIVGFASIMKIILSGINTSLLGEAFLYSMNYALAFIAIYLLNFTLATKQPAMSAAKLAEIIDEDLKLKNKFEKLTILVARIFRSQFIAFVGNAFMAFTVALGIIHLWYLIYSENFVQTKAETLILDLNIIETPVIFHAALAGVFLFISGLIAGNVYNKTKYRNIPERIKEHPILKRFLNYNLREKLANFYDQNMGGISSNFWFGIFMGSTSTIGVIIGLNLDIRHIAFAAGNFALGLYGLDFQLDWQTTVISILGIGLIGFTNFIVSFILTLLLALSSREVNYIKMFSIFGTVKTYFLKNPFYFFFPPKNSVEELIKVEESSNNKKT